ESFVPRPSTMMSSPVAFGSRVPQWPTFLMPNRRRIASTTSWEVGPAGLSMMMAPSSRENSCISQLRCDGLLMRVQSTFDGRHDLALDDQRRARNTCSCRCRVATSAKLRRDFVHVHILVFRS